jgi:cellulose synthase/poly-beta-1,6-N-acetylglucosamine synthase-like glycosyltransferase
MKDFVYNSIVIFQIATFVITMYYLLLSLFGLYKKEDKGAESCEPQKRFALLVAAHNEEMVIGKIVESLLEIDYPKEMYDIFVIADNCNDNTASIAREHNVNVCERNVTDKRGKGYALEWMFDKIFKMDKKYDAIAIFDADNLVSKNFLKEMNYKLLQGYKVVQGYIDSKNPHDSWITESYSIAFWSANRLFQLARANVGLSNQIGGTGFCMDAATLKELGWGATCLTEDLEFSCKLILNGHKVGWAHDAIIYDEKPLTLKQSWNQRKRWMQGFADVASRFFFKLMKKAVKEKDFVAFDCALYVVQPFVVLLLAAATILTFAQNSTSGLNIFTINQMMSNYGLDNVWKVFCVFQFLLTPFIMVKDKKLSKSLFAILSVYSLNVFVYTRLINFLDTQDFIIILFVHIAYTVIFLLITYMMLGKHNFLMFFRYLLYGIYTLTWIPITIQGIMDKDNKEWSHTKHVRQIGIQEVE